MALAGFKITNHPQQVGRRGASDTVDERITPQWLFDELNAQHGFTLDAAANAANTKVPMFFDIATDGLLQDWFPHTVWCNPPYSNLLGWVAKAHHEARLGTHIVMLLPANRTEQRWWQDLIEPYRDQPGSGLTVRFLARRINFGVPGNEAGKFNSSPPFGLAVVTWRPLPSIREPSP